MNDTITHMTDRPGMDLADWYPLLTDAGIPAPATIVITTDVDLTTIMDGIKPAGIENLISNITHAADQVGYPCFLRTGHGSGKHQWSRTCHLASPDDVMSHIAALIDWSYSVDFFGLPHDTWVVRELLPVEAPFLAFDSMPIAKERRYFTDSNGTITGHHPYWPTEAVRSGHPRTHDGIPLDPSEWEALLDSISTEPADEVAELTELTRRVTAVISGAWSIDWLYSPGRGWVCIDMAHAERSYVWAEHPNAPHGT